MSTVRVSSYEKEAEKDDDPSCPTICLLKEQKNRMGALGRMLPFSRCLTKGLTKCDQGRD